MTPPPAMITSKDLVSFMIFPWSVLVIGGENTCEQEKPEAGKLFISRAESRQSTARCVGRWRN
jgi:hypothetical protein